MMVEGIPVKIDNSLGWHTRWIPTGFPRSKKKRIKKKYPNRTKLLRYMKPVAYLMGNVVIMNSKAYDIAQRNLMNDEKNIMLRKT